MPASSGVGLISSVKRAPISVSTSANFIEVGKRKHRLSTLAFCPGTRCCDKSVFATPPPKVHQWTSPDGCWTKEVESSDAHGHSVRTSSIWAVARWDQEGSVESVARMRRMAWQIRKLKN